jgi:alkanesulfonate monooxygenase SsuD/methylene tetrahydromethanopterin reductase-like flavin-dependent oxidoreductase (luciferase family)
LERAGYRTAWTNEVIGKDALVQLAVLLGATERMVFGTSIANIWAREPQTLHAAAVQLVETYPDRFVLGLGVGLSAAGGQYRTRLRKAANHHAWAGEIFDGALPAGLPPEFTAHARQVLGPHKLLVIGLSVIVDPDPERARTKARETVSTSLGQPSYAATIGRLGYSAAEIDDVSNRLVDATVGHGDPAAISATVQRHLTAGADTSWSCFRAEASSPESVAPVPVSGGAWMGVSGDDMASVGRNP